VEKGEPVSIMGGSGSGKTTLMKIIGLPDKPSSGTYEIDGRDVLHAQADDLSRPRNRLISFVFQSFFLLPRINAWRNIGDLESFHVRSAVDEIDIGMIRVGPPVSVTGDGFSGLELTGRVTSVAAQASGETSAHTGMPNSAATVSIEDIPPGIAAVLPSAWRRISRSSPMTIRTRSSVRRMPSAPEAASAWCRFATHSARCGAPVILGISTRRDRDPPGAIPRRCGGAVVRWCGGAVVRW
jgi:hypothetical protein